MNPTIIISAYNRPIALQRLLSSLVKASYPDGIQIRLVISIDRGEGMEYANVTKLAEEFSWTFGPKEMIKQSEHLGLVRHFLFCCGLSKTYDQIIYLEDDLIASPAFYTYTSQAFDFYHGEDRLAALSLYALWFNGYTQQPFVPISDGSDVFFLQMPYTQGLAFTSQQWRAFSNWLDKADRGLSPDSQLHDSFLRFGPEEWFPTMAKFVVETGRYVLYPRVSLTSGAGDAGVHFDTPSRFFQTPLEGSEKNYHFQLLEQSNAVYDSFFEILPSRLSRLTDAFNGYEYDIDLYATKSPRHLHADHVLTSRKSRAPKISFGKSMWPMEVNVIENVRGDEICFCRTDDVRWDWLANLEARKSNHDFFTRKRRMSRRLQLEYVLLDLLHFLQRR